MKDGAAQTKNPRPQPSIMIKAINHSMLLIVLSCLFDGRIKELCQTHTRITPSTPLSIVLPVSAEAAMPSSETTFPWSVSQ